MNNIVEETPWNTNKGEQFESAMGYGGKNQSFYRKDSDGNGYCWMAVDANTGTVDIRDNKGESLFVIDAEQAKVFISGNPSVDLKKKSPKDILGRIVYVAKKVDATPQSILEQISKDGLLLQANQRLSARADGQLLINDKTFKGEKGEKGDRPTVERVSDGVKITGFNGSATVKDGPKGENAPDVGWRLSALEHRMNLFEYTQVKKFDFEISYGGNPNSWIEAGFVYFGPANKSSRPAVLFLELDACGATSANQNGTYEYEHGAYIDFEITFQAGNNNPEVVSKQGQLFCPRGGHITQTLTIPHKSGADHRVYRIKFKKGKYTKRAWIKGQISAVQL